MASYKLKPQKVNAQGTAPLQLWYFHNREYTPFALGYSTLPNLVDIDGLKVSNKAKDADVINEKIRGILSRLYKVLDNCKAAGVEPMPKLVKEKYFELVAAEEQEAENLKVATSAKKGLKAIAAVEEIELDEAQKELDTKKAVLKADVNYQPSDSNIVEELLKWYDELVYIKSRTLAGSTMKTYTTFRDVYFNQFVNSKTYKAGCKRFGISIKPEHMTEMFKHVLLDFYTKEKNYNNNSIGKHLKTIKIFLDYIDTKGLPVCKEFRKFEHYKDTIDDFIIVGKNSLDRDGNDLDEFELLWEFQNKLDNRELKVHSLMIFGLLTGLRIGEILKNDFVIFTRNNKDYLYGKAFKNSSETMLPLWKDERLQQVLDKHNPDQAALPKTKRVYRMQLCSDVEFNRVSKTILKSLYEHHNINQYKIPQHRMQLDKKIHIGDFFKYELFHAHSMRRSAITKWRNDWQLSPETISALIGTAQLEVLETYRRWDKHEKTKLLESI